MDGQYSQYLMYLLSQLMKKNGGQTVGLLQGLQGLQGIQDLLGQLGQSAQAGKETAEGPEGPARWDGQEEEYFTADETGSVWRRETNIELLTAFCREGYPMAQKHGHFLVGTSAAHNYIAVPGRFLISEQPAGGKTGFTLWQPLTGGEELYQTLDAMTEEQTKSIYGYWIAAIDPKTLVISEA